MNTRSIRAGFYCLILGYLFSQFYRTFLAVLVPTLESELGLGKQDLASASGWWFLAFGAMQIPVGIALDRIGPRNTTWSLLLLAAAGAFMFSQAQAALTIKLAMALIGIGCAPILVASYFILAREFPPIMFGFLASITIGLGSLGDMAASLPFSLAASTFGWRETMQGVAVLTLGMAALVFILVKDPAKIENKAGESVLSLFKIPALWPILALMLVCYAPPAALRGLWLGPYFHDIFGFTNAQIGQVGLAMGFALVAGSLIIGPVSKKIGSMKRAAFWGNAGMATGLIGLWATAGEGWQSALFFFLVVGIFGVSFPIITAHARLFIPSSLMGRGVALVNLFGIAAVGIAQEITGRLFTASEASHGLNNPVSFGTVFGFFAITTLIGLSIYHFAKESPAKSG